MLDNQNLQSANVLLRVDFNVPLDAALQVTDNTRIKGAIPTINDLYNRGARVIIISHLGRPLKDLAEDGSFKAKYSLSNLVSELAQLSGKPVTFIGTPLDSPDFDTELSKIGPENLVLLENTRFYKGEEKGDIALAQKMASLASYYVNDAFGAAHREHASTATVANYFDAGHKDFGHLMRREVDNISKIMTDVSRPFLAIVGGAKVSDKIELIKNLMHKVDKLIIGGGMAFTFIRSQGGNIGSSLCEEDKLELASQLLEEAKTKGVRIVLPVDAHCGDRFSNDASRSYYPIHQIPDGWSGFDIGPDSIQIFEAEILESRTILWNGPMGVFEFPNFATGTLSVAKNLSKATMAGAFTVVGGGDSVAAISQAGLSDAVSFVSTGGGAMLEMIEGKELPGIKAIKMNA